MVKIVNQLVPASIARSVTYSGTNTKKFLVIHETANKGKGANAKMHANLQSRGNSRQASWNYQVDDKQIIKSFSDNAQTWGAGSQYYNQNGINIEICVNSDGNFAKAVENAAELIRYLRNLYNIPVSNVVTHQKTSGWKECPRQLLRGSHGINWNGFIKLVRKGGKVSVSTSTSKGPKPSAKNSYNGSIVDYLHQEGINTSLANRKNLAVEYGVVKKESEYSGTANQNTALLNAMMNKESKQEGTRKGPISSSYKGNSVVDYLVSVKMDNSFSARKKYAKEYLGIDNYSGTAQQNKDLLNAMRGGTKSSSKASTGSSKLAVDGYWGKATTRALQSALGTVVDGVISKPSNVVKAIQKLVGARVDGYLGPETYGKLQAYLGTPVDKKLSKPSLMVKEMQRRLNAGTFVKGGSKTKGKSIDAMAKEVIAGKHGQGHANRRKSLGISEAEYKKVRDRVNKLA